MQSGSVMRGLNLRAIVQTVTLESLTVARGKEIVGLRARWATLGDQTACRTYRRDAGKQRDWGHEEYFIISGF